ncbi:MAG: hypothetical protein WCZ86_05900 [Desulfurivibrionaceae bacterium]|jgi:hypothetical protein
MFDRTQFRDLVTDITMAIGLHAPAAVNLLLGTAAQESRFGTFLKQIGTGPALGVFQMEPATERDIWENYLRYHPDLIAMITGATGATGPGQHLRWNLAYQIAMARVHYLRRKQPLPSAGDLPGLAGYWKQHYNTTMGAGTVEEFMANYRRCVLGQ